MERLKTSRLQYLFMFQKDHDPIWTGRPVNDDIIMHQSPKIGISSRGRALGFGCALGLGPGPGPRPPRVVRRAGPGRALALIHYDNIVHRSAIPKPIIECLCIGPSKRCPNLNISPYVQWCVKGLRTFSDTLIWIRADKSTWHGSVTQEACGCTVGLEGAGIGKMGFRIQVNGFSGPQKDCPAQLSPARYGFEQTTAN